MRAFLRRYALHVVVASGLLLRLAVISMPGTEDMKVFQTWGALALRERITRIYAFSDADVLTKSAGRLQGITIRYPPPIRQTDLGPIQTAPDYPPGSLLVMQLSAATCQFIQGGPLRRGQVYNACINFPPVLFSLAIVGLLGYFLRSERLSRIPLVIASFWLNPALILTSPVLGYQEPVFGFFGISSLVLYYRKKYTASVLSLALSCLIKPQGVFIVPILGMAAFAEGGWRMVSRCGARLLLFLLVGVLPFLFAGRLLGLFADILAGAMELGVSNQQLNIWWLVGAGLNAVHAGTMDVFLGHLVPIVGISDFNRATGISANGIALAALAIFTALNLYFLFVQLRQGNRFALFWAGAAEVFGYTMLMTHVHENHLYAFFVYVVPLLALQDGVFRRLFWALSATYGLNLYLFDGFGRGFTEHLNAIRTFTRVDLTIPVALVNLAIFLVILSSRGWWFGRTVPDGGPARAGG